MECGTPRTNQYPMFRMRLLIFWRLPPLRQFGAVIIAHIFRKLCSTCIFPVDIQSITKNNECRSDASACLCRYCYVYPLILQRDYHSKLWHLLPCNIDHQWSDFSSNFRLYIWTISDSNQGTVIRENKIRNPESWDTYSTICKV